MFKRATLFLFLFAVTAFLVTPIGVMDAEANEVTGVYAATIGPHDSGGLTGQDDFTGMNVNRYTLFGDTVDLYSATLSGCPECHSDYTLMTKENTMTSSEFRPGLTNVAEAFIKNARMNALYPGLRGLSGGITANRMNVATVHF